MKEGMFMESQLIYQTDKQLILKFEEENIELPTETQNQIKDYWQEKLFIQPTLVNGPIYSIHKIKKTNPDELTINIRKTDYAHYLYAKEQGLNQK